MNLRLYIVLDGRCRHVNHEIAPRPAQYFKNVYQNHHLILIYVSSASHAVNFRPKGVVQLTILFETDFFDEVQ